MSNLLTYPLEDNFETTLSQSWNWATGTVYVNDTPSFTFPSTITTYIVVNPGKTNMQVAKVNAYDSTAKTFTVSSISVKSGAGTSYTQQSHASWSVVRISDNYQFWEDIATAIATKVNTDSDSLITTNSKLEFGGTWAYIYSTDGGTNLKFKDTSNSVTTLSQLTAWAGTDHKVLATASDTTAWYLDTKITVTAPVVKAVTSPAGDERLNISHDFTNTTYYKTTSAWSGDSGKVPRLNASWQIDSTMLVAPLQLRTVVCQQATYDTSTASGSLVITHNLGYAPTTIDFICQQLSAANCVSWGTWDWTNNMCTYKDTAAGTSGLGTTYCGRSSTTSNYASFVVASVTTTTMTLTVTKNASATGNISIQAVCKAVA